MDAAYFPPSTGLRFKPSPDYQPSPPPQSSPKTSAPKPKSGSTPYSRATDRLRQALKEAKTPNSNVTSPTPNPRHLPKIPPPVINGAKLLGGIMRAGIVGLLALGGVLLTPKGGVSKADEEAAIRNAERLANAAKHPESQQKETAIPAPFFGGQETGVQHRLWLKYRDQSTLPSNFDSIIPPETSYYSEQFEGIVIDGQNIKPPISDVWIESYNFEVLGWRRLQSLKFDFTTRNSSTGKYGYIYARFRIQALADGQLVTLVDRSWYGLHILGFKPVNNPQGTPTSFPSPITPGIRLTLGDSLGGSVDAPTGTKNNTPPGARMGSGAGVSISTGSRINNRTKATTGTGASTSVLTGTGTGTGTSTGTSTGTGTGTNAGSGIGAPTTTTTAIKTPLPNKEGFPSQFFIPPLIPPSSSPSTTPFTPRTTRTVSTPSEKSKPNPTPNSKDDAGATPAPAPRCNDSCSARIEDKIDAGNQKQNDFLQRFDAVLDTIQTIDLSGINAKLDVVNNKLGAQLPGGLAGTFGRLYRLLGVDRWLNLINTALLLHNALMLSRSLGDTAIYAINSIFQVVGFKFTNEEGNEVEFSSLVGHAIEDFIKSVVGTDNYTALTDTWKKANRVYQAAANILYSVQSLMDSARNLTELAIENTGKIGNALRKAGAVFENAYGHLPERGNARTKWQKKIDTAIESGQNVEETFSTISNVTGEIISIQDQVREIGEQQQEFKDAIEATKIAENTKEQQTKTNSQPPTVEREDLVKPGG